MFKNKMVLVLLSVCVLGSQAFASKLPEQEGNGSTYLWLILGGIALIVGIIGYGWVVNSKISKKEGEAALTLSKLSQLDSSWDESELINHVEDTFYGVQRAIFGKDYEALKRYIHPQLFEKWKEQIEEFPTKEEANRGVENINIVDVKNYKDDEKDVFTASVDVMEAEYTVDKKGNLLLAKEDDPEAIGLLTEYWTFERENKDWVLLNVSREAKWKTFVNSAIVDEDKDREQ